MTSLDRLDKIVDEAIRKMKVPGIKTRFKKEQAPGIGYFFASGAIGLMNFEYHQNPEDIEVKLCDNDDVIYITADKDEEVYCVFVNDREYERPCGNCDDDDEEEPKYCREEIEKAIEFGIEKLRDIREYLKEKAPEFMKLVSGYFSRSLLPIEDQPSIRFNEEIFEKFSLKLKKA